MGGPEIRPVSRGEQHARLAGVAALSAFLVLLSWSLSQYEFHKAPPHAKRVLDECKGLNLVPTPPPNFASRDASDRFVVGTKPTLITNATIWTGGDSGNEVLCEASILLHKGIIKQVGTMIDASVFGPFLETINARGAWISPALIDMHSHAGVVPLPVLAGSYDVDSLHGITQPWLRSLDGIHPHDASWELARAGGVGSSLILPGSLSAIGGQAFMTKTRLTQERSALSMVLEPPYSLVNGTDIDPTMAPRWRHIKHAAGENPSSTYGGTRMDTIWSLRKAYNEARKVKRAQDAYCIKAEAGQWSNLDDHVPFSLEYEALVDVLRGRVKVNVHIYETVDFTGIVGLSNEFEFPIAAFHHAHEAYLVPDVIKKTYGGTPGVALYAIVARYKKEAYRGSEFAPRILHDQGIRVAMKSDGPFPINSRDLLFEAAQAHHYGLNGAAALASVTSVPAELTGFGHRLGYLKPGYDADVVMWDSHPLALGATPKQLWVDGIPQFDKPFCTTKPDALQRAPLTPSFNRETKEVIEHDGLPPLRHEVYIYERVTFTNVKKVWTRGANGKIVSDFSSPTATGRVVVEEGRVICAGSCAEFTSEKTIDLAGGTLSPGLVTYGSSLGLTEISLETSPNDGYVPSDISGTVPSLLSEVEVKAVDGLMFGGRDMLHAYRAGVTRAITAPQGGMYRGLSVAFMTNAEHRLDGDAIVRDAVAIHVTLVRTPSGTPSISTQIGLLRSLLLGKGHGERGKRFEDAAQGKIPLAVDVERADHIASLLALKTEIDEQTGAFLRLILVGASEAHLLAPQLGAASPDVAVILAPVRAVPVEWDQKRFQPDIPLSAESAASVLLRHGVLLGIGVYGVTGGWSVRNTRFDAGWLALQSNGTISEEDTVALVCYNIEKMFGIDHSVTTDLVVWHGGDWTSFEARVAGIMSGPRLTLFSNEY